MESGIFYVVGEDIEGNLIEFDFNGNLDSCIVDCKMILDAADGGHLDIFIVEDKHEVFVQDVEV